MRQALLGLLTHLVVANSSLTQQCLQKLVAALLPPPYIATSQEVAILEADTAILGLQEDVVSAIERVSSQGPHHQPHV